MRTKAKICSAAGQDPGPLRVDPQPLQPGRAPDLKNLFHFSRCRFPLSPPRSSLVCNILIFSSILYTFSIKNMIKPFFKYFIRYLSIMSKFSRIFRKNKELEQEKKPNASMKGKIAAFLTLALFTISNACANASATTEVNWTQITDVIDGFVGIVPSFAGMISAVMPVILMIAMYAFIMRFWKQILDAVGSAMNFFK